MLQKVQRVRLGRSCKLIHVICYQSFPFHLETFYTNTLVVGRPRVKLVRLIIRFYFLKKWNLQK